MSVDVKAQDTTTLASVKEIYEAATESRELLTDMREAAEDAHTTLEGVYQDAESAKANAASAVISASTALNQLDVVQNVVGVLDLLSKNGSYQLTSDTDVNPDKWYFIRTGTSPDYAYQVVSNPSGDPSAQGYYELTDIDQAVRNYVSSHLVLDSGGLWLQTDGSNAKLRLANNGIVLYGTDGAPIAKYGEDAIIGNENGFYIKLDSTNNEIGFYQGSNKIAYLNGAALYVQNSLSFGHFIFYERDNGHFTLKRIS